MPEETLSGEFSISNASESELNKEIESVSGNEVDYAVAVPRPSEKENPHFYSSYCYYPKNVKFINQESDEEIILLIRRRFIVNIIWIATGLFAAVAGPLLIPIFLNSLPIPAIDSFQMFIIIALYLLVIFGFLLTKFTLWYFHVGIVTNKRIKDIDIHGVLFKDIAETRINLIQDVKYSQIGFLPSLFNFGDVFVQTAGSEPNIEFDKAPTPAKIAKIIGDMLRKH